jgi:hypothetical protein
MAKGAVMGTSRKARGRTPAAAEHDDPAGVAAYLAGLDHPLKPVVEAIRATILGADPAVTEGVKWTSASFYRRGWFATINARARGGVQVVFHHGPR